MDVKRDVKYLRDVSHVRDVRYVRNARAHQMMAFFFTPGRPLSTMAERFKQM